MASNDFLTFAGGAGANVLSQADYVALAASIVANGFSAGTAQSAQLNKVWRQSSIMAAVLAQLIVDTTGQNAVDDGTTATLLANLKAAVSARSITGPSVIGAAASVPTASASVTITAARVVVSTALAGGLAWSLAGFSQTLNLAATGAGGMDTGAAPNNGYVAAYAIYNPTTNTRSVVGFNSTSAVAPEVYSGANMPAGFTGSQLLGVFPTNGSGQVPASTYLRGRWVNRPTVFMLNTTTSQGTFAALNIASAVPPNAIRVKVLFSATNSAVSTTQTIDLASDAGGSSQQSLSAPTAVSGQGNNCNGVVDIVSSQSVYYRATNLPATGTPSYAIYATGYKF